MSSRVKTEAQKSWLFSYYVILQQNLVVRPYNKVQAYGAVLDYMQETQRGFWAISCGLLLKAMGGSVHTATTWDPTCESLDFSSGPY